MAIKINKLTNVNVYFDGANFAGRAEEVDVPELNFKMAEHKGLGLFGTFELPSGLDKMEARIKWAGVYPEVLKKVSNPYNARQIKVHGNLEEFGPSGQTAQTPVKITMSGFPKKLPGGKFKQHDNTEMETTFTITACKMVIGTETIFDVDVYANIFYSAGQDVLSQFRANS